MKSATLALDLPVPTKGNNPSLLLEKGELLLNNIRQHSQAAGGMEAFARNNSQGAYTPMARVFDKMPGLILSLLGRASMEIKGLLGGWIALRRRPLLPLLLSPSGGLVQQGLIIKNITVKNLAKGGRFLALFAKGILLPLDQGDARPGHCIYLLFSFCHFQQFLVDAQALNILDYLSKIIITFQ